MGLTRCYVTKRQFFTFIFAVFYSSALLRYKILLLVKTNGRYILEFYTSGFDLG